MVLPILRYEHLALLHSLYGMSGIAGAFLSLLYTLVVVHIPGTSMGYEMFTMVNKR